MVITFRPEFSPPWDGHAHVTAYTLNRLGRRECGALLDQVTGGKTLPEQLRGQIVDKTDGVPLFVEELTKAVLESNLLEDRGDHYALAGTVSMVEVPATLHDSLMARLDRLLPVKEVAQIGAALGREFSYELIARSPPTPAAELAGCARPTGRLAAGLPARCAAQGHLHLQARPGPGRRLRLDAQATPPAAPLQDREDAGAALSRDRRS